MKSNFFKQIGAGVMIGLMSIWCFVARPASVSFTIRGTDTNLVLCPTAVGCTNSGNITAISCTATAAVAFTFALYDSPNRFLTNITGAWTNYTPTVQTNTTSYVDILNNTNTISYLYITNIATVMTNATSSSYSNAYQLLGVFSAPSSSTVYIPYTSPNIYSLGLFATNLSGGGNVTIQYNPYH